MNILPEIKEITNLDKKNLMATFAKLGEEHGELARVILAYANEPSILHRFATTNNIVEECIDVALVALSIAFKAGADEEQLENMFRVKMNKWGDILHREGRLKDIKNIPFEIHITCLPHNDSFKESFREACKSIGVKPISLELMTSDGIMLEDNMTSSKFFGTNSEALAEANRIANEMDSSGIMVSRIKIETVPWHPSAPQNSSDKMPRDCYFEAHVAVHSNNKILTEICKNHDAYYSKNINKVNNTRMNTIRVYTNREDFDKKVKAFCTELNEHGINHEPVISEFAIYDSNSDSDALWLS